MTEESKNNRAKLKSSLEDARKKLQELKQRKAGFGELTTPAHILVEIDKYKGQITKLEKQIRDFS